MSYIKEQIRADQEAAEEAYLGGDYVRDMLRKKPAQIADLQSSLCRINYSIEAKQKIASRFEAQASANAEGKNAEARKATKQIILDGDDAYQIIQSDLAGLRLDRDTTAIQLQLARDTFSASKAEAYLIGGAR